MPKPTDVRPVAALLIPADQDADAAEVRARDHDRGHLRPGPPDGRRRPGPDAPRAGARRRSASSGSGRARCPTRRGTRSLKRFCVRLAAAWARLRRRRATRSRSATRFQRAGPARPARRVQRRPGGRAPSRCPGWRPWSAARPSTWPCTTPTACSTACRPTRPTTREFMNADLSHYLDAGRRVRRARSPARIPTDFLVRPRPETLPAWHLVGGKDPIDAVGADRRRARRRLPRPAPRLDPPRRPEVPEGQAPRRRRRLGLRPAASRSARSPSRRASTG